jgi:hypothetical protein
MNNTKISKQFNTALDAKSSRLGLSVGINAQGKVISATSLQPDQLKELLQGLLATI